MRICIISGSFPPLPCGVGDSTRSIAAELSRMGHHLSVVTSTSVRAGDGPREVAFEVQPVVASWRLRELAHVAAAAARAGPDVVLLQYPTITYRRQLGIFLLPLALRLVRGAGHRRVIVIVHEFRRTPWLKRLAIAFLVASAHRSLVFPEDLDSLRRFLPAPLRRISPRPPSPPTFPDSAVGESDRARLRDELGCVEGESLLVYFGFISPRKGLHTLVGAVARLVSVSEVRAHLVVAGDAAPGMTSWVRNLRARAVSLGLGDRVTWLGHQEDGRLLRLLKAADMCVLPFEDGFSPGSASFAQAAACGVPIVTTRPPVGSASVERVRDGVHVLLVPPGDSEALSGAIRRLIDEPELRDRLSANVRELSATPADTARAILESVRRAF
jgi:glycosyltransferase involved in cell wall biosynthesis